MGFPGKNRVEFINLILKHMNYRTFGNTKWEVSEIGYGMWGMAGWTGSDDKESMASLQRAVDLGCNFFDTAWGYGAAKVKVC